MRKAQHLFLSWLEYLTHVTECEPGANNIERTFIRASWKQFRSTGNPAEDHLLLSRPILSKSETKLETAARRRSRILGKGAVLFTCGAQVDMESWNVDIQQSSRTANKSPERRGCLSVVFTDVTAGLQHMYLWTLQISCVASCKKKKKSWLRYWIQTFPPRVKKWDWSEEVAAWRIEPWAAQIGHLCSVIHHNHWIHLHLNLVLETPV